MRKKERQDKRKERVWIVLDVYDWKENRHNEERMNEWNKAKEKGKEKRHCNKNIKQYSRYDKKTKTKKDLKWGETTPWV